MTFGKCSTHQHHSELGRCDTCERIALEGRIFDRAVLACIKAGYSLDLSDGEETVVKNSKDLNELHEAAFSTDDDRLYIRDNLSRIGWIWFVYGNDGFDVISDYTVNLENILKPVNDYADKQAEKLR